MKIRPLHDRVVVRRLEQESTSAGGIILTGSAQEKPNRGEIVAIGRGKQLENGDHRPLDVSVGNIVLFGQYSGSTVTIDGEEYQVMREDEIFAVIED